MARGFQQTQILLTCVELGGIDALDGRRATAAEVASAVGTNVREMALLLNAAAALGLLEKCDGRFVNTSLAEACLPLGGAGSMARSLQLEGAFYRRWGHLAEAVRTGQRPEENRRDEQPDDFLFSTLRRSLFPQADRPLPAIVPASVMLAGIRFGHVPEAHAYQALPHHGVNHCQVKVEDEHGKGDDEGQIVDNEQGQEKIRRDDPFAKPHPEAADAKGSGAHNHDHGIQSLAGVEAWLRWHGRVAAEEVVGHGRLEPLDVIAAEGEELAEVHHQAPWLHKTVDNGRRPKDHGRNAV
jgi:hypothetical protein